MGRIWRHPSLRAVEWGLWANVWKGSGAGEQARRAPLGTIGGGQGGARRPITVGRRSCLPPRLLPRQDPASFADAVVALSLSLRLISASARASRSGLRGVHKKGGSGGVLRPPPNRFPRKLEKRGFGLAESDRSGHHRPWHHRGGDCQRGAPVSLKRVTHRRFELENGPGRSLAGRLLLPFLGLRLALFRGVSGALERCLAKDVFVLFSFVGFRPVWGLLGAH